MLLLQEVLTCSVPPAPGLDVVMRMLDVASPGSRLLPPPDLPVELPEPVVLRGGEAGGPGGGGPGHTGGGGDH